jgi:hypothetical protein
VKPAATWQTDYQNSSGKAGTNWVAGIQAPNVQWAQPTINSVPRMVQGFNAAASSGRIAQGISTAGDAKWRTRSEQKVASYTAGITSGAAAYGVAAGKLYQFFTSAIPALPARGDINQNLQRANTLALALHAAKGQFAGR